MDFIDSDAGSSSGSSEEEGHGVGGLGEEGIDADRANVDVDFGLSDLRFGESPWIHPGNRVASSAFQMWTSEVSYMHLT